MTADPARQPPARLVGASARTLFVALAANVGVAVAKIIAAIATGSTAMLAEAAHAIADVGNQLLLAVAQRRSRRPADDRRPFGYGREAYFWAFIASVIVFVAGAAFSLREGILELLDPIRGESFLVVYTVLAVSMVFDTISLVQSILQLRHEAHELQRDVLEQVMLTSDPTVRAVFAEDAAAITGDAIALLGVGAHQLFGISTSEGVAAVLIGLLLIAVGIQLARRNHDFLLGEQAPSRIKHVIAGSIVERPEVIAIRELLVTFVGPRQIWVLAKVHIDADLRTDSIETLIESIEDDLLRASAFVVRVDIVPVD